ncbi:MAG: ATP-binding protein [Planctomycetaceae bacterium]
MKILLLEDEEADYQIIYRALKRANCPLTIIWTEKLSKAAQYLETQSFDVILTDLNLPDSSGIATVKKLREINQEIALIVLTGLEDEESQMASLSAGAQDYIDKGNITTNSLLKTIRFAVQRQEHLQEKEALYQEVLASRERLAEQKQLLKKKNRRLRRLYQTAHRFVDNVSHEFRTPLTVIKDYVSLVQEGAVGEINQEQNRMLSIVGVRADDLNNMVDDMLDISKLESGLIGVWRQGYRLQEIIESVCHPLMKRAELKGIQFVIEIPTSLPAVFCDAEKVGRTIINLVTNAMKFCGSPGLVRLWVKPDLVNGEAQIGISDNGPGIDPIEQQELFKRFKQLSNRFSSRAKGFGLGLNIVRELVELNLGDLTLESSLGAGTTFMFTLPINRPEIVLQNYLQYLEQIPSKSQQVAMITASLDEQITKPLANETDAFFNCLLRKHDLMLRLSQHRWLFLLHLPCVEIQHFVDRAQKELKKVNRNRPFGLLPEFDLNLEGCWQAKEAQKEILTRFNHVMQKPSCGYKTTNSNEVFAVEDAQSNEYSQ